ncbi:Uncharacterized protein dnm_091910 [Desulfonema magnum]|uniref:Uncharacterized protein n=1 Tax=Desulfonema magnum TaxID=45655 RepID=A0A975BWL8_9BACT|nr:Uncharacterized protein dnm_091910 [Desulfonema magnum]
MAILFPRFAWECGKNASHPDFAKAEIHSSQNMAWAKNEFLLSRE